MKKAIKKFIAVACVAATMSSVAIISASALTRRLYGDVNGDGVISKADSTMIQEYLVGSVELDKYQLIAADVNADGYVNISDATDIQMLLAGAIDEFEAGDYFVY